MTFQPNTVPLVVSGLVAILIVRALITGCASARGDAIRRDEDPLLYWIIIALAVAFLFFLLLKAFSVT